MKKDRRSFVKKLTGSVLAASAAPAVFAQSGGSIPTTQLEPRKKYAANDKIRLGAIGMGIMGFNNCDTALRIDGVELVAACDLYEGRLKRVKEVYGDQVDTTRNYKEILDRKDIDAVVISTTDHWHDVMSIEAMQKGKAVYCEKPMVHHLDEGAAVIKAQKDTGAVFQVGSQRVSSIIYDKARELYEAGDIGQLILADIRYDRQSALGAWQYSIPPNVSEKEVDWKAYLGDAPKIPFDAKRFFRWRNYQDYGTAVAGDLFVHLFSGLHVITGSHGPNRIFATGGLRYWKDGRDVPDVMLGSYDYPETQTHPAFNVQMRVNFVDGAGGGSHIKLIGSEGVLTISGNSVTINRSKMSVNPGFGGWDTFGTFDEATQAEFKKWYAATYPDPEAEMQGPKEMRYEAPRGYSDHYDHWANFFEGMRNGKHIVEDATFGLRAAGPALASNLSYYENKPIMWDPDRMMVV